MVSSLGSQFFALHSMGVQIIRHTLQLNLPETHDTKTKIYVRHTKNEIFERKKIVKKNKNFDLFHKIVPFIVQQA